MSDWNEYRVMVMDTLKRMERKNAEIEKEISEINKSITELKTSFKFTTMLVSGFVSVAVSVISMFVSKMK